MESLPQEHPVRNEHHGDARPAACEDSIPGPGLIEAANDKRMSQLVRTIEHEIIPRLMLAHRAGPAPRTSEAPEAERLGQADVERFALLMLVADDQPATDALAAYRAAGVSIEAIYVDLMAPAARHLGDLWVDDRCSFTDVTVGLGRLQRLLRELSPSFDRSGADSDAGRSVLLMPCPGEQHTFGLVLVSEFFRRGGWKVSGGGWNGDADAGALVGGEWFDAIGFSLGAEIHLPRLAQAIRAVKHGSCNPDIVVLVGGPLFADQPHRVNDVGADGMTIDGREAPALAERLIGERGRRRSAGVPRLRPA